MRKQFFARVKPDKPDAGLKNIKQEVNQELINTTCNTFNIDDSEKEIYCDAHNSGLKVIF